MAQFVLLALAGVCGFVGCYEAAEYQRRFEKRPLGFSARVWAVGCFFLGLMGAFVASAAVLGLLFGWVGYRLIAKYERTYGEGPMGVSALLGAVACCVFGLFGALFTSTVLSGIACGYLALVGELVVLIGEKDALVHERDVYAAENRRLLAEKNSKPAVASPKRVDSTSSHEAATFWPQELSAAPPDQKDSGPTRPAAPQPHPELDGSDLLPRR